MAIARVPSNSNRNRRARDAIFIGNASKFERFLFFFFALKQKELTRPDYQRFVQSIDQLDSRSPLDPVGRGRD